MDSYTKGYYSDAISFFKTFYGNTLKDSRYLKLTVMTGILRVAKENIISGLNNLHVKSIMCTSFSEYFGVTEQEVGRVLKGYDLEYEQEEVQYWYNGYFFGNIKTYNPWSTVNFLSEGVLTPYWGNLSENSIIKEYLQKRKWEIFEEKLKERLLENTGLHDLSGKDKEQFYHGLFLGMALFLKNEYELTSNNFSVTGIYDI